MLGIFLDTETTGLNAQRHRILEIAYQVVDLLSGKVLEEYQAIVSQPKSIWEQSDPTSLKINGFTFSLLSQGKTEELITKEIIASFQKIPISRKNAIFVCQNPSFDRIFFSQIIDADLQEKLHWPYHWLDLASMYFALALQKAKEGKALFPWKEGLSKDQIAKTLGLYSETLPHRAMNGVCHLLKCYEKLLGFPEEAKTYTQ